MNNSLTRRMFALLPAMGASACSPTDPETVASLKVDSSGNYSLNGRVIPEDRLVEELRALRSTSASVALEVWAEPDANYQAVARAVVAAQRAKIAGIRFASQQTR